MTDRVQEVLVFVTVALAAAYLVRKLFFSGGRPRRPSRKPDVPVAALRRKRSGGERPSTDCHS